MGKLLLVLLVVALVGAIAWSWRRQRASLDGGQAAPRLRTMVACAHCGLHIPASEALMLDDRPFCSAAHREAGPKDPR